MKPKKLFAALLALVSLASSAETTKTLWSGSTALGNWEGNIQIAASEFSAVEKGDVLEVTISELDDEAGWHQIVLSNLSTWDPLPGCAIDPVNEPGVYRKDITEAMANSLRDFGLAIAGCYLTVSQVTLVSDADASTVIWTPDEPVVFPASEWTQYVVIPHSVFADANVGDILRLNIQDVGDGAQGHISYIAADWSAWLDVPDATEYKQLSGSYFEYTITEKMLPILKGEGGLNGIVVSGVGFTLINAEIPVLTTISKYGWGTLYYSNMKLKVPENVEARTYTVEGDVLKTSRKYEAGDVIPKGEAVVLKDLACDRENPHTYAFVSNTESEEMDTENLLKGFDEAATTTGGSKYYMLTNGDNGVGFYWGEEGGAAFTSAAHKAYLALPGESPIKGFSLEDETTAIETLAMPATGSESQEIYNLAGQRMSRMQKGLNIVNGKKILVK